MLIPAAVTHRHIDRDQARRRAQMSMTPVTRSWSNAPIVPPNIYDFRRIEVRTERRQHAPARHRQLHRTETEQGMPAYVDAPSTIIVTVQDAFREKIPSISTALTHVLQV